MKKKKKLSVVPQLAVTCCSERNKQKQREKTMDEWYDC